MSGNFHMPRRRNHVYSLETLERRDCPAGFTLTPLNQVVAEGDPATFELTLNAPSQVPESVIVTSKSGTAIIGSDFMQRTERITFFPGETTKTFSVPTLRDPVESIEGAENFTVIVQPIGGTPSTITSLVVINDFVDNFQIDFVFNSDVPPSLVTASALAANLWQSVIIGNLPEVNDPQFGVIDDIQINVQLGLLSGDSDGDGNTLAQARPLRWRPGPPSGTGLPYLAEVGVDEADISNPELTTILAHEFGHALGMPQSDGWYALEIPDNVAPTHFTGVNAVREYNQLFGTAADPSGVPIEQDGGPGTAFAHWDDVTFGNELMTGALSPGFNPLSVITVGAFDDIGYDVNYDAAQPYTPPVTAFTNARARVPDTARSGLPNAVDPLPVVTPPPPISPTVRVLPPRITFPDKSPMILTEDNVSRQMVRSALEPDSRTSNRGAPFSLHHLSTNQRAILAAWASIGQETTISLPLSLTSVVSGPKLSLFANEIFDASSQEDAA